MTYFKPAVQLGLTATPKRKSNVDTYKYFGEPVYKYSLKDGITDGFLTPFKVRQIATSIDDYTYTPDDAIVEAEVVPGKRYIESEFNRVIVIPEREEYRVKLFMNEINQNEKTLVFCATQAHALMVRDMINRVKTNKIRITACASPPIRERSATSTSKLFRTMIQIIPTILTTSQKLSTGVDARNVRNIVLMRPINSMIEFKQIIGHGTRLFDGERTISRSTTSQADVGPRSSSSACMGSCPRCSKTKTNCARYGACRRRERSFWRRWRIRASR